MKIAFSSLFILLPLNHARKPFLLFIIKSILNIMQEYIHNFKQIVNLLVTVSLVQ